MSIQHVALSQVKSSAKFSVEPPKSGKAASKLRPLELVGSKYAWFDARQMQIGTESEDLLRAVDALGLAGIVLDPEQLDRAANLTTPVIAFLREAPSESLIERVNQTADTVILDAALVTGSWLESEGARLKPRPGVYVKVTDATSLESAARLARSMSLLIVDFDEETKIPLEIVLAEAQNFQCQVVVRVADCREAQVVFGVLEFGANGVIIGADNARDMYALVETLKNVGSSPQLELAELTITKTMHVGMGDRACVDVTSYLSTDEGILIGCFSSGAILACSETHPLPYMPTRPFRVNAGALQMYVLAPDNRTWYLSDLRAGMEILAVSTNGKVRRVTVGRVKIERRPMLYIEASAPDGTVVASIMQEDWHVRVFGDEGGPRNITRLQPGDKVLGFTMDSGRHVGVKVDELIIEQ